MSTYACPKCGKELDERVLAVVIRTAVDGVLASVADALAENPTVLLTSGEVARAVREVARRFEVEFTERMQLPPRQESRPE